MRAARTVMVKELVETLRDWRTLLVVFLAPLLITPVTALIIGLTAHSRERSDREEILPVGLINTVAIPGLPEAIGATGTLHVRSFALQEDAEAAMREQSIRAVLVVPADAAGAFDDGRAVRVEILFDGASDKSRNARQRLERALDDVRRKEQLRRLEARGLDRSLLAPFEIRATNVASPDRTGGFVLGAILPYIVILWTVVGGMNAAFDMCAGEKERGTMETLLVSAASRRQLIAGKLGAVWVLSVFAALFALAGLVISALGGFRMLAGLGGETFEISWPAVGTAMVAVLPLALMMSSLLLVVSAFARNQKEAHAYVFPLTSLVIVAALLSSILGQEHSLALAFVPVLNTALAMKQVLAGLFNIPFLALALASSVLYALLTLRLAVSMFERESVLFRA